MKNLVLSFLLVSCLGFQSCKKNETQKEAEAAKSDAESIVNVQCYKAVYENDTIDLKLNTLKNGKISGDMVMKIAGAPLKNGEIKGEFKGDTLFADYAFIEGTNKDKTFKNPMAFLKREKQLIIGNGAMETYLGRTYFAKGKPIDFERVKYKLEATDCVDK
ncbi:hypothetical protein OIU80_01060 [Flavobacterium sp. LS1R47]|jgi:hypothetical protein|uniref:Lipoprotein n=1 Tax=Flavobacterium frigoritolerans TaxID=2987686 RepID=A0A9X2YYD0_9FLAO|nr:hypothetical protein [Flavobacterium frigoritolerans]MCV9930859.1 hypothetical protein [Flavobacterium frigoritolerans]